jgi:predicted nuclease of predicted toxin-antitoxin system
MKIKLDENLPHRLAAVLKNLGHEADTAHEEQLAGHTDAEIWQAAQKESRFLITQDLDFPTRGSLLLVRTMAFSWCVFILQAERT